VDATRCVLELERAVGASQVETDRERCSQYVRDESYIEGVVPFAVVHARDTGDIARTLSICDTHRIPVFPRAAGSGKTGGAVPTSPGIVLDTLPLARVKEIDRENLIAIVEPGVITGKLHEQVEAEGLFYPPDPNSLEMCAIGGNVAENAGGPRAFKYGVTREYVYGLEAVLMNGTVLRTGKRTVKGVTGYDVTALLVGSEGTLAVFTEATLRLIPKPPEVRTLLALFSHVLDAGRAVSRIVARGFVPRCLELLDRECCDAVRESGKVALAPDVQALLIIEVDGEGATVDTAMERVGNACMEVGAIDVQVARHGGDRDKMWAARRAMSHALRARARFKMSEDIVVPRSRLGDMLERVAAIGERERLRLPSYGHAGDGNLHVNFLWDDPDGKARVDRAIEEVFRTTIELGGTLTGEHGLGVLKREYLPLEQSEELIEMQRRIKDVFDPHAMLNPGKMFPARGGHRAC
jgi:glycolate oxidase